MTIAEINALVMDDDLKLMMYNRLFNTYYMAIPEPRPVLDQNYTYPTFTDLEHDTEFEVYRQELLDVENERLRKKDLQDRYDALHDVRAASPEGNPALWLKNLMSENPIVAEAEMVQLETDDATKKAERDSVQYKSDRAAAYAPTGDQLDQLIKSLKFLKTNGTDIGIDGDTLVAASDTVKTTYPKP